MHALTSSPGNGIGRVYLEVLDCDFERGCAGTNLVERINLSWRARLTEGAIDAPCLFRQCLERAILPLDALSCAVQEYASPAVVT
jgi:hypothetical protein